MKANLKIIIPIIISIAVIIAALLLIKFEPNQKSGDISPLSTAQKYLTESNYEQAIIEFKKAIELDPMNADAYLGLAQAYEKLGDIENAVATLEKGYELTGDERIKAALDVMLGTNEETTTSETTTTETTTVETATSIETETDLSTDTIQKESSDILEQAKTIVDQFTLDFAKKGTPNSTEYYYSSDYTLDNDEAFLAPINYQYYKIEYDSHGDPAMFYRKSDDNDLWITKFDEDKTYFHFKDALFVGNGTGLDTSVVNWFGFCDFDFSRKENNIYIYSENYAYQGDAELRIYVTDNTIEKLEFLNINDGNNKSISKDEDGQWKYTYHYDYYSWIISPVHSGVPDGSDYPTFEPLPVQIEFDNYVDWGNYRLEHSFD